MLFRDHAPNKRPDTQEAEQNWLAGRMDREVRQGFSGQEVDETI